MSTHSDCGEDITWVRNPNDLDRYMPPFEFAGYRYVMRDLDGIKIAVQEATYVVHHCNPEKVLIWNEYKKKLAEAKSTADTPSVSDREAAKQLHRDESWEYALKYRCPNTKCDAPIGRKCINLSKLKKNITEETLTPHPQRLDPRYTEGRE